MNFAIFTSSNAQPVGTMAREADKWECYKDGGMTKSYALAIAKILHGRGMRVRVFTAPVKRAGKMLLDL